MGAPGFWDEPESAAKVGAEHTRTQRRLEAFTRLQSDAADLEGLVEIAEDDEDLASELEDAFSSVESRLAALEEERLFSGKYDAGDALVTVNAGAGGTDAQDWAEMVLRMMMRWAERRGFKAELLEATAGEEAGIKSATFKVSGENAYGLYGAEKGVHRLVRLSPFDSANRRQTSFAGVEVAPVIEGRGRGRDRLRRPAGRHVPRLRSGRASTSTRPTPRCASPTARAPSSCSARTSARRRRTARPR
jgi:peptide chain release factor 2